ncbi:DUF2264 domain-containing protein [Microbacterium aquimaris]|uniref:DUF2264 domain-containing protein n=1 Tax=Microbacterium aquimaris TaxID=459816 RepID=A0ABU5N2Q5_9MICO|nr:DUF2264 domain-containing protein [Microbacterium aquimaris]MDZ8160352.1 DUF2264 domain-containing protein [Microbacterium aquimaris]
MSTLVGSMPLLGARGLRLVSAPTPPEDRARSPYTGLTRDHWIAAARDLVTSAVRYRSSGGARLDLPGRPSRQGTAVDGLEGFARTFQLAGLLGVADDSAGTRVLLDGFLEGLMAGTDAWGSAEYWGPIGHVDGPGGQPQVEAAGIALSLHFSRTVTWDRLDPATQDSVAVWLAGILDKEPSPNNWYLFPLTVGSFLEAVGRGDDRTRAVIDRGLALIDTWYRGRGWYSDGDGEAFDHYVGWALHLYPMMHAHLRGDALLLGRLGERLEQFLASFSHMFDRTGAPLYMGRSMTYRTATGAALAVGALTGHTPLAPGQSRRLLSANLRHFLERDVRRDGILVPGWYGPHEPTVQRYSGPGSPYWASKGFLGLLAAADSPLWTAVEEPLPGDRDDRIEPIGPSGLLVQTTASDGIVRVHNHGSDNVRPFEADAGAPDPLYARYAYSTRTGPTALHNPSDNHIEITYRGLRSARRRIHRLGSGTDWMASWSAIRFPRFSPLPGSDEASHGPVPPAARIEAVTIVRGAVEVRVHRLRSAPPGCALRLSGWALAAERPEELVVRAEPGEIEVAGPDGLRSRLLGVVGWPDAETGVATWGTAFGPWASVPTLRSTTDHGLYVALASLSEAEPALCLRDAARIRVDGSQITVVWAEGGADSVVDLDALDGG